jgi:hypothetical protein
MKKLLFLMSALALLNACDYDSEEALYGIDLCDTESISYENDIATIIVENCISCHSGESPSASLDLSDLELLTASALNSGNRGLLNRIERSEGQVGAMPTSYRLTQCQIDQINAWVEQGALDN